MGKVITLPQEVVSRIAAGEVIERPASVVKELLENSLDAQSTEINITIKNGGKTFIHVQDDGTGIEEDDLGKIFLRHTTSKIRTIEDLWHTTSLGFRGEALYSIASVSDIVVKSKTSTTAHGWQLHLRGNKKLQMSPVNMNNGTDIEVRELFYNTPARRKFLKSDSTELFHIIRTVIPYCLLHPHLRLELTHYKKNIISLPQQEKYIERAAKVLNIPEEEIIETTEEIPEENLSFHLLLGSMNIRRPRRDMQFIFVNRRPVKNNSISFHMNQLYRALFPRDSYPFFIVFINLPAENVDVNVHPSKREVKIKNEQHLCYLLSSICEKSLLKKSKPKIITYHPPETPDTQDVTSHHHRYEERVIKEKPSPYLLFPAEKMQYPSENTDTIQKDDSLRSRLAEAKYIGNFLKKYLLFEAADSLLVIDQHAAQERIGYERLLHQMATGKIEKQQLIQPLIITLLPTELVIWEKINKKLEENGFVTTLWAPSSIAVHSYPQLISNIDETLHAILSDLEKDNIRLLDKEYIAKRACRSSLKAGYEVDAEQANYIRTNLLSCNVPFTCPHGRPTVIEIQEKFLNRQFLRE